MLLSPPAPPPPPKTFTLLRLLRALPALIMLAGIIAVSQMAISGSASSRYHECSALAAKDPAKALQVAHAWRARDPQSPVAGHCEAIALYAAHDYTHAAAMLEALTHNAAARNSPLTADLAVQAAIADNAGGQNDKALLVLSSTLSGADSAMTTDDKVLLLSARAKLYRAIGKPLLAVQDLDDALTLQPENADVKALLTETAQKTLSAPATLPESK